MNKQIEALKMAIEELEYMFKLQDAMLASPDWGKIYKACKEALAEAESESSSQPVAFNGKDYMEGFNAGKMFAELEQTAQEPATWQSLSDDEIFELHHKWIINSGNKDTQYDFARAIEQALKEKNHA